MKVIAKCLKVGRMVCCASPSPELKLNDARPVRKTEAREAADEMRPLGRGKPARLSHCTRAKAEQGQGQGRTARQSESLTAYQSTDRRKEGRMFGRVSPSPELKLKDARQARTTEARGASDRMRLLSQGKPGKPARFSHFPHAKAEQGRDRV